MSIMRLKLVREALGTTWYATLVGRSSQECQKKWLFAKKPDFWRSFFTCFSRPVFLSIFEGPGTALKYEKPWNSLYCRTKSRFAQSRKNHVLRPLLPPFWRSFWSLGATFSHFFVIFGVMFCKLFLEGRKSANRKAVKVRKKASKTKESKQDERDQARGSLWPPKRHASAWA